MFTTVGIWYTYTFISFRLYRILSNEKHNKYHDFIGLGMNCIIFVWMLIIRQCGVLTKWWYITDCVIVLLEEKVKTSNHWERRK